jgi:GR25 family glycosyltransferase involved in LPS biosynthesis
MGKPGNGVDCMRQGGEHLGLKAMIIHLARAEERRDQVEALRATLPCPSEVVWAIDARTPDAMAAPGLAVCVPVHLSPRYPYALRDTEVACFHSHRACWQRIVDEGLAAALILEDDIALDPVVFPAALRLALGAMQPGDYIRFPYKRREDEGRVVAQEAGITLRQPQQVALGMQAQIVTQAAAQRLLRATARFDRPVDCLLQMPWEHGARVLTVWPSGVTEHSAALGGSTIGHKALGWDKIRRELLRPVYRSRIARLSRQHFGRRL